MAIEEVLKQQVITGEDEKYPDQEHHVGFAGKLRASISHTSVDGDAKEGQIFSMNEVDAVLDAKMRLLNRVSQPFMTGPRDASKLTPSSRRLTRSAGRPCT